MYIRECIAAIDRFMLYINRRSHKDLVISCDQFGDVAASTVPWPILSGAPGAFYTWFRVRNRSARS